ncbi:MAG: hypothetical protein IH899_15340, partial [Planctomycetes bacterium]|nr:hypothetical protein [Planctomycetota bacterium]
MAEQHDPLDPVVLFEHVQDSGAFHGPMGLTIELPLHLTKYMVLEVVVAVIMIFLFVSLGRRMSDGSRIRGRFWNLLEVMVVFIRDEVARPAIGKPDADKLHVVACVSHDGELSVYVQKRVEDAPDIYRVDDEIEGEGRLIMIRPDGMVIRYTDKSTRRAGRTAETDYFYPIGEVFKKREEVSPKTHPEIYADIQRL